MIGVGKELMKVHAGVIGVVDIEKKWFVQVGHPSQRGLAGLPEAISFGDGSEISVEGGSGRSVNVEVQHMFRPRS